MAEQQARGQENPAGQQKQGETDIKLPDPMEVSQTLSNIAETSHKLVSEFIERQQIDATPTNMDPLNIGNAFLEMTTRLMADPAKIVQAQMNLWQDYMYLWQSATNRMLGHTDTAPVVKPEQGDRRFKDPAWDQNEFFDFIKQSYLISARWLRSTVNEVDELDEHTAKKIDFYTRQFVDAMAPSNFLMTNPEALRTTVESGGENLIRGLENLLEDMERGKISQTDYDAFEVGKNLAVTPGKVVYENDLMQLIQYQPSTENVYKTPLLIIPPWINKYYILDLREKNSFIKWCVDKGFTVFIISWVNPDQKLEQKTFEYYMTVGPLKALDVVEDITGETQTNLVGYCLGGTLLTCTLSYLNQTNQKERVKTATFLTTMADFSEAGELEVFIDEEQINALEEQMRQKGYLEGKSMANTFNMLRANDLIWSFVINNYLLGKDPFPFDLLYWNSDSTRMPAEMHSFYLRKMYQENKLIEPGGITLKGIPVDLGQIEQPAFALATKEDHIAPWKSGYALTRLTSGPVKFVLAASGHIAGVVNPPAANKYNYWLNSRNPKDPDRWFENAKAHDGSWWPEWHKWIEQKSGTSKVEARNPGGNVYVPIEEAPGRYVKMKA